VRVTTCRNDDREIWYCESVVRGETKLILLDADIPVDGSWQHMTVPTMVINMDKYDWVTISE